MLATAVVPLLNALLLATFLGMLMAWGWAIRRVVAGQPLLPARPREDVPWGTLTVLAVLVTFLVVSWLVVNVYSYRTGRSVETPLLFHELMLVTAITNAAVLVVVPLVLRATSGATPKDLGLSSHNLLAQARIGAVAFLLVALPVNLINILCALIWTPHKHPLEKMIRAGDAGAMPLGRLALLAFLTAVIFAPAAEELLFRGVLQGWLERLFRRRRGTPEGFPSRPESLEFPGPAADEPDVTLLTQPHAWSDNPYEAPHASLIPAAAIREEPGLSDRVVSPWPVVLTSFLFALLHAPQWPAPIAIFFLSLALGAVYQRTGSLVASFVFHALFNGLSTLVLFQVLLGGNLPVEAKKVVPPEALGIERSTPKFFVPKISR